MLLEVAVAVLVTFVPPTERVDDMPLSDSEITEYKYDLHKFSTSSITTVPFHNTGDMTEFTLDLPVDRYLVCLHAKAGQWSLPNCAYFNLYEPQPPRVCQ